MASMRHTIQIHEQDVGPIRWALVGLSICMLLSSLGTSIANVALPTLVEAFDATFRGAQWIVLAYLLAITSSIVGVGKLGDLVGRRRLLKIGLLVFTAASLVSGVASALWLVIAARAAQGLGAAVMMALALAFVSEIVPKEKTGSAMGLLGTMSALGTALGPSLGGVLVELFGWRAIFLVNVPLGLGAVLFAHRYLPADRSTPDAERAGFDSVGAMLRNPAFGASLVANVLVSTVLMATLVVGPFYLALALRLDTAVVGIVMSIGPIVAALTGIPAGRIVDRWGARRMTLAGLGGVAIGSVLLSVTPEALGIPGYVIPIVIITANYALFQAANNTAVMRNAQANQRGVVSGTLTLSRNLGLIAGASVMGAVFALAAGTHDITAAPPEAVAVGMRITFAVATALIMLAVVIVAGARALLVALALLVSPSVAFAGQPTGDEAPAAGDERGFVLRSADGANSLRILGLFQPQFAHSWVSGAPDENALFVNRARVGLLGSVFRKDLQYMFVAEFGGGDPRLLFLNVDYTFARDWLTIRVGQFKRPFSRPFITFASQMSMIDRPSTVGPGVFGDNADIGVMLHNGTSGQFEYAVGVFNGTGPGVVPDRVHPLVALRVGYNTAGLDPYVESDLDGGAPRFGIAAAGLVDFDQDGDHESYTSGLVDVMFKARGFAASSAIYAGSRQSGSRWSDQRFSALGHHTQLGYVIAGQFEPVVRYSLLMPSGPGNDQHDIAGGLNMFFRGHAFKWQNFVTLRLRPGDGNDLPGVSFQSQLSLSF